jgi:hypothetical protein
VCKEIKKYLKKQKIRTGGQKKKLSWENERKKEEEETRRT